MPDPLASFDRAAGGTYLWTTRVRRTGALEATVYTRNQTFTVCRQASFREADPNPSAIEHVLDVGGLEAGLDDDGRGRQGGINRRLGKARGLGLVGGGLFGNGGGLLCHSVAWKRGKRKSVRRVPSNASAIRAGIRAGCNRK